MGYREGDRLHQRQLPNPCACEVPRGEGLDVRDGDRPEGCGQLPVTVRGEGEPSPPHTRIRRDTPPRWLRPAGFFCACVFRFYYGIICPRACVSITGLFPLDYPIRSGYVILHVPSSLICVHYGICFFFFLLTYACTRITFLRLFCPISTPSQLNTKSYTNAYVTWMQPCFFKQTY